MTAKKSTGRRFVFILYKYLRRACIILMATELGWRIFPQPVRSKKSLLGLQAWIVSKFPGKSNSGRR